MAKIMLVEDDNNLREIYGARLLAEGHVIVAAQDGEEALALAVKEKPDLIISDVMMPRISGFDMLDILRNAPETKDTKVIMMTALSQAEDKARADKLGADRYLVKSQVTLEDVANVVREVLDDGNTSEAPPAEEPVAFAAPVPSQPVYQPQSAPEPQPVAPVVAQVEPIAATPESVQIPTVETPAYEEPLQQAHEADPAPTMPDITTIPDEVPVAPSAPATVEQIANPAIEMPDDSEPTPTQAPPTQIQADRPITQTIQPLVEPAAPITVELPVPLDGNPGPAPVTTPQSTATSIPVTTDEPEEPSTQSSVGPNLLEALQAEENDSQSQVVAPHQYTQQPAEAQVSQEESAPEQPFVSATSGQRVIQPLGDVGGPDISALLAAEEEKAAVENPAANTVIKPVVPVPQPQAPIATPSPQNDDVNSIAL